MKQKVTYADPRDLGAKCDECPFKGQIPVFAQPSKNPVLAVVGQDPGRNEEEEGIPFVGRSGRRLNKALNRFDIPRASLHVTNARLCRPPYNATVAEKKLALECCRPRLANELNALPSNVRVILALGAAALQTLTGKRSIMSRMGGPLPPTKFEFARKQKRDGTWWGHDASFSADFTRFETVVPTAHPAMVLRSPHFGFPMTVHIARAWGLQTGAIKPWKWPKFHLWPDASMVRALERILKSNRPVGMDTETGGTSFKHSPIRVVGLSNIDTTISSPWEAYDSLKYGSAKSLWSYEHGEEIEYLIKKVLTTKRLVGQNFTHDILMMKYQANIDCTSNYWFDTLLAHRVTAPRLPHKLGFIANQEFHNPAWKTDFGDSTEKKGIDKFFERPEEELRIYNAQDSYMTAKLVPPTIKRLGVSYKQLDILMENLR